MGYIIHCARTAPYYNKCGVLAVDVIVCIYTLYLYQSVCEAESSLLELFDSVESLVSMDVG
jgi:hypothetical protein